MTAKALLGAAGDTTAIPAGYAGERIVASAGPITVGTSATTITSITLTPGIWDISLNSYHGGTASTTAVACGIATATNSTTGYLVGDNYGSATLNGATNDASVSVPAWRVSIASSTTYYLTAIRNGASGNGYGRISAVRIA